MTPTLSIILPTYNEAENIPIIVDAIHQELSKHQIHYDIWVMDDHSPDGTAAIATKLQANYPIHVVDRQGRQRSLSAAVLDGFATATGDIVAVMDADLSHPVSALPSMVDMINHQGAHIVVGSRNISGGGSDSWPFYRQWISRCASWLTFGLTPMSDPTTGFMAIRRSILKHDLYNPIGWKIVLEIVAKHPKAPLKEVPIIFQDRQHGKSKMSPKEQLRYIRHLLRLYDQKWPAFAEFVRYAIVGVSGLIVDMVFSGGFIWMSQLSNSTLAPSKLLTIAAILGFSIAFTTNFILNRLWTFRSGRQQPLAKSYVKYGVVNSMGLCTRILIGWVLTHHLPSWHLQVNNLLGIFTATAVNYYGAKYWVFQQKK